jgi:hypothetical protein
MFEKKSISKNAEQTLQNCKLSESSDFTYKMERSEQTEHYLKKKISPFNKATKKLELAAYRVKLESSVFVALCNSKAA